MARPKGRVASAARVSRSAATAGSSFDRLRMSGKPQYLKARLSDAVTLVYTEIGWDNIGGNVSEKKMLKDYLKSAMKRANIEKMDDGRYFGHVEGFPGPWADGDTEEECRRELEEVFEEWLV
ncbi:MAG: hypothetical protein HY690_14900, partial [Chloroflexi bacterium]|nr:hypothetical protein [Chloroflexota bacterium]